MSEQQPETVEWFQATEPLYIGLARAHNPGDRVIGARVEKHGWTDKVVPVEVTAPTEGAGEGKPPSVQAVLEAVGDDPAKAAAAIEAETARGNAARSTLVGKLQGIVDAGGVSE